MRDVEAQTAHGFDDFGWLLGTQMRHGAEDREPEVARHLLRIPHFGIGTIEHDCTHHAQSETGHQYHQQKARRCVLKGTLRHNGRVENPHIRDGGLGREPGLIVPLLQRRVGLLFQLGAAIQPDLFNGPGGNPAQIARRCVYLSPQLPLARCQLRHERTREFRYGPLLQLRDFSHQTLQRRIRVVVPVSVCAQQRLLDAQLVEGVRQLRRMLHRSDGR